MEPVERSLVGSLALLRALHDHELDLFHLDMGWPIYEVWLKSFQTPQLIDGYDFLCIAHSRLMHSGKRLTENKKNFNDNDKNWVVDLYGMFIKWINERDRVLVKIKQLEEEGKRETEENQILRFKVGELTDFLEEACCWKVQIADDSKIDQTQIPLFRNPTEESDKRPKYEDLDFETRVRMFSALCKWAVPNSFQIYNALHREKDEAIFRNSVLGWDSDGNGYYWFQDVAPYRIFREGWKKYSEPFHVPMPLTASSSFAKSKKIQQVQQSPAIIEPQVLQSQKDEPIVAENGSLISLQDSSVNNDVKFTSSGRLIKKPKILNEDEDQRLPRSSTSSNNTISSSSKKKAKSRSSKKAKKNQASLKKKKVGEDVEKKNDYKKTEKDILFLPEPLHWEAVSVDFPTLVDFVKRMEAANQDKKLIKSLKHVAKWADTIGKEMIIDYEEALQFRKDSKDAYEKDLLKQQEQQQIEQEIMKKEEETISVQQIPAPSKHENGKFKISTLFSNISSQTSLRRSRREVKLTDAAIRSREFMEADITSDENEDGAEENSEDEERSSNNNSGSDSDANDNEEDENDNSKEKSKERNGDDYAEKEEEPKLAKNKKVKHKLEIQAVVKRRSGRLEKLRENSTKLTTFKEDNSNVDDEKEAETEKDKTWICVQCTFSNSSSSTKCEMCENQAS